MVMRVKFSWCFNKLIRVWIYFFLCRKFGLLKLIDFLSDRERCFGQEHIVALVAVLFVVKSFLG